MRRVLQRALSSTTPPPPPSTLLSRQLVLASSSWSSVLRLRRRHASSSSSASPSPPPLFPPPSLTLSYTGPSLAAMYADVIDAGNVSVDDTAAVSADIASIADDQTCIANGDGTVVNDSCDSDDDHGGMDAHDGHTTPLHVERYCATHSSSPSRPLRQLERVSTRTLTQTNMLSGRSVGALLRTLVSLARARRVLEIGSYSGYSALAMLEALHNVRDTHAIAHTLRDTHDDEYELVCVDPFTDEPASQQLCTAALLTTTFDDVNDGVDVGGDHSDSDDLGCNSGSGGVSVRLLKMTGVDALVALTNERNAAVTAAATVAGPVSADVDVDGHASSVHVSGSGGGSNSGSNDNVRGRPFDFVFIDADKSNQQHYVDQLLDTPGLLAVDGTIVVDNTLWYARVCEPDIPGSTTRHRGLTRKIHAFNEWCVADVRVDVQIVPMRDGLTILRRSRANRAVAAAAATAAV